MRGIPDQIGVGNGIKTFCPPFDPKELCSDHSPPSQLSVPPPQPPLRAFQAAAPRPAFVLCTHWQHSIIRPRQLQPARLTTEEFDVPSRDTGPYDSSSLPRFLSLRPLDRRVPS